MPEKIPRHNNGRDIQSDLLALLANAEAPMTVAELQQGLLAPLVSETAIRSSLSVMQLGWARRGGTRWVDANHIARPARWFLTAEGRRVAEQREASL